MARLIFVVAETGCGKSYSLRNLDPETSYIINVAGKELPFPASKKKFNKERKNYQEVMSPEDILKGVQAIGMIGGKYDHVKTLAIDDFQYIMTERFMEKALVKGFDKFTELALSMYNLLRPSNLGKLREDLSIIILTHGEVKPDGFIRAKTIGKMLDEKVTLDGLCTVSLHVKLIETSPGQIEHKFMTKTDGVYSAKTPPGMFKDALIDNDLAYVLKRVNEYYVDGILEE